MSKRRAQGVKKCLERFSLISDEVETIMGVLPSIAKVSVKDLARSIAAKHKIDYTSTLGLVSIYCRLRAADGKMLFSRGILGKNHIVGK